MKSMETKSTKGYPAENQVHGDHWSALFADEKRKANCFLLLFKNLCRTERFMEQQKHSARLAMTKQKKSENALCFLMTA